MECLQGVPAASVITKNGKFWPCDNKYYKSCELFCPDQDRTLFETALLLWKTNGAPRLVCPVHQEPEKMRVVKNVASKILENLSSSAVIEKILVHFGSWAIEWKSRDRHAN